MIQSLPMGTYKYTKPRCSIFTNIKPSKTFAELSLNSPMFMLSRHYHKERQKGGKVLNTWAVKQAQELRLDKTPIDQN